ncbi:hypothetical protein P3W45_000425 [Vairimorpha bombi]|jgi:hypothetical protein
MSNKNVHKNYMNVLKKLKISKESHSKDPQDLDDILDQSNILFTQISNASELKLDAKVTEIHSGLFLKNFTRNIQDQKLGVEKFIKHLNDNKLDSFFIKLGQRNRRCEFTQFIDFNYMTEIKNRKIGERLKKDIKDVMTPSKQRTVDDEINPFFVKLEKDLRNRSKIFIYDVILDFDSYDRTVENIFNLSIAIRSKIIKFIVEDNKIFCVRHKDTQGIVKYDDHVILDINYNKYIDLVDKYRK